MKHRSIISFLIFIQIIISCNDQLENKYENYQDANANNYFEKGWIPDPFIYTSMTDIYQRGNMDINSCIFSYNLSEIDFNDISSKVQNYDQLVNEISGIDSPKSWSEGYERSAKYFYLQETDTIHIALDNRNLKVFGCYFEQKATIR
jgi:hypothetical protein